MKLILLPPIEVIPRVCHVGATRWYFRVVREKSTTRMASWGEHGKEFLAPEKLKSC